MPRVSKKNKKVNNVQSKGLHIYRTAIYVRLSVEDERKADSDSIGTQKAMLERFLQTQPDLQLYDVYEDVNYSGTNFNRPGFIRLMRDIEAGLIDCVAVKDLSRLGRNYKETGHYLERIFPICKIRFIAVADNFDTLTSSIDESSLSVPLKNLMNDIQTRDISRKVKSSFNAKQKRGEFCGVFAPYGYIKTGPALVIDEEAAPIIKMIFGWRLDGMGIMAIARKLNSMKILPPSRYRFQKGITKAKKHGQTQYWHKSAVKRILENPGYMGNMVQARYKSNLMNGGGIIKTSKDEWITVENTHPAIIDKDIFCAAQKINSERTVNMPITKNSEECNKTANIFKGLIFCGDCGKHMCRLSRRDKYTYACYVYSYVDKHACTMKPFREAELKEAVFSVITAQIKFASNMSQVISKMYKQTDNRGQVKILSGKVSALQYRLDEIQGFKKSMSKDFAEGFLLEEDYCLMFKDFDNESEKIFNELGRLDKEKLCHEKTLSKKNEGLDAFQKFVEAKYLTAQMLAALVRRIDIYGSNRLEITLNYQDEFEAIQEYISNIPLA